MVELVEFFCALGVVEVDETGVVASNGLHQLGFFQLVRVRGNDGGMRLCDSGSS